MTVRLTNLTGLELYYEIKDYEGPFAHFAEQLLPGQYPNGQDTYTTSDIYSQNLDTKVGNQRYSLSSRYPKFNNSKFYLSDADLLPGNFSQQKPAHRAYDELQYQFPPQRLNTTDAFGRKKSRILDGNREGIIPKGLHRDIMLKDINCNIFLRTMGKPSVTKVANPDNYIQSNGRPETSIDAVITYDDPRLHQYEGTIKVARLRDTNVLVCLNPVSASPHQQDSGNTFYMYDSYGVRIQLDYTHDNTIIALGIKPQFSLPTGAKGTIFANRGLTGKSAGYCDNRESVLCGYGANTQPLTRGTYIDSLRTKYLKRKSEYGKRYVDMTDSNYSDDYDKPILGYFDRRWLNYDS